MGSLSVSLGISDCQTLYQLAHDEAVVDNLYNNAFVCWSEKVSVNPAKFNIH